MGIPSYFHYLLRTEQHKLFRSVSDLTHTVDWLCYDLNCCIHLCVRKAHSYFIAQQKTPSHDEFENRICHEVCEYMDYLQSSVSPRKGLYVAVDGVVPYGKMKQQRYRRFKSVQEKKDMSEIYKTYGASQDVCCAWDTNAITPGTRFMVKLDEAIKCYIQEKQAEHPVWTIHYSSHANYGEGEHKVFEWIETRNSPTQRYMIYGLDADLIMLSLLAVSKGHQATLLREKVAFGRVVRNDVGMEELIEFDTVEFSKKIIQVMMTSSKIGTSSTNYQLIRDYVVLMFLLGNDFVPHSYSLPIRNDSMPLLIETYHMALQATNETSLLTQHNTLQLNVWNHMFTSLARGEMKMIEHVCLSKCKRRKHPKSKYNSVKEHVQAYETSPQYDCELESTFVSLMKSGDKHSCRRFIYKTILPCMDEGLISTMCLDYMKSIQWCVLYYLEHRMPDITFYYTFHQAPFFQDLSQYKLPTRNIASLLKNGDASMITPTHQLLCVLPPHTLLQDTLWDTSTHMDITKIKTIICKNATHYFPTSYPCETFLHRYRWENTPFLPFPSLTELNEWKDVCCTKN